MVTVRENSCSHCCSSLPSLQGFTGRILLGYFLLFLLFRLSSPTLWWTCGNSFLYIIYRTATLLAVSTCSLSFQFSYLLLSCCCHCCFFHLLIPYFIIEKRRWLKYSQYLIETMENVRNLFFIFIFYQFDLSRRVITDSLTLNCPACQIWHIESKFWL